MTIEVGSKLPEAVFRTMKDGKPENLSTAEIFAGKKVVLFAVPGAFTPTCSMNHLPGYLENHAAILAKGVDTIAVISTNDVFVMDAWAKATNGQDKILYLADGNADFTKAVGMDVDLAIAGMGLRTKRYSMIIDDGVVASVNIESKPGQAIESGAATILEQL